MSLREATPIQTWVHGSSGRMGKAILEAANQTKGEFVVTGGSARTFQGDVFHQGEEVTPKLLAHSLAHVQLVLDFSTADGTQVLLEALKRKEVSGLPILIGATGLAKETIADWRKTAKDCDLKLLIAPNTSLGILLISKVIQAVSQLLSAHSFDVELVEAHHRHKKDAPSGTAHHLADLIAQELSGFEKNLGRTTARDAKEIGLHSVRGGSVFGEHEIRFLGDQEELSITHRAFSRDLFARGALVLSRWLIQQNAGIYQLTDVDLGAL